MLAFVAASMTAYAEESNGVIVDESAVASTELLDDDDVSNGMSLSVDNDGRNAISMHLNVGFNVPLDGPSNMSIAPLRSWEVGWTVAQYDYRPKNTRCTLSAGIKMEWKNWTLRGHDDAFIKVGDVVGIAGFPAASSSNYSRIHVMSFSVPLLFTQQIGKKFSASVGGQVNWNAFGSLYNYYETGDDEVDVTTRKIGQRPFTFDIMGIVRCNDFGVYCKYSPMSVLKKGRGPEFKSITFGLYF